MNKDTIKVIIGNACRNNRERAGEIPSPSQNRDLYDDHVKPAKSGDYSSKGAKSNH